ncbi:uncharacterized protein LOC131936974 [Physella acuta]|uniref:uncharacterized protein LOC131936974 n=1 Tax=Physella acuta TaxID=109671 RepID=UPI0027DD978F|nr:uncharacterized protein LOC131936974 [Physella acuta]XP_059150103.1 uncharacterized protein LOC131936974 [Physella acuta]XP_059150104.1 uncharacterized protein LOC131936974 [Physella acuta]XP_059150106.1 uncharacterized protein LOC131936974 [Physella acuta]
MDSAQGRGGRQPQTSASNKRVPDLDRSTVKDGKSTSKTSAHGGATTPSKSSPSFLSPNDAMGLGDVVSRLKQQGGSPKPRRTNDVKSRPKSSKDDPPKKAKPTKDEPTQRTKSSSKDGTLSKSKGDKKTGSKEKILDEKPSRKSKESQSADTSKLQTPKNKRRARSASRPRDTPADGTKSPDPGATSPSSPTGGSGTDRRASIPVIRLSREDSKKQSVICEDIPDSPKFKRRLSVLSQAKIAFEKVAMAVTDAETVTVQDRSRPVKDRKTRSHSAPREINPERAAKSAELAKKKSHSKTLSRDLNHDKTPLTEDDGTASTTMQQSKQQHRKTDVKRKDARVEGEISLEGVSTPDLSKSASTTAAKPSSSNPLKLLHSITRPSSLASSSPRQTTPSRPRKKFSRGHIDQDPLEVDYEVLDDRVTSIEPRRSVPSVEPRRSIPYAESHKTAAEEPLLAKHRESISKQGRLSKDQEYVQPAQRPQSIPYVQTFPRTKQQETEQRPASQMYTSATMDPIKARKATTPSSSDRLRSYTNQLSTPDSAFSPLFKVPSSSSFTSSDARSDVCLDLPDVADPHVSDLHLREAERDLKVKLGFPNAPYSRIVHYTDSSLCLAILSAILVFLVSFVLVWPLLVIILVIVPVVVLLKRLCSWLCCCGPTLWGRCCLCFCHTHLTSSELMWLGRGSGAGNSVAQSLMVLQKGLDTDRIRNLIDSRLLSVENRHGHKIYPRFTQKVVPFCCGQAWVADRHFILAKHVYNMPGYIETLEDLQQFISKMATQPLSLDHPLWEIQVLHNFREPRDTVLLFRMHLCMTDGVSIVHVLENALVDSQKTTHRKSTFSSEASNTSPFKVMFSGPVTFLSRYLFSGQDVNLIHGQHVHSSGEMVVAWSEPFSLSAAMRVKQVVRCTLSELLLSITAGNIRTYLQVSGITHPFNVKCGLPVDFQSMDGGALDMENKYAMVVFQLPTNTEGTIPRLWETKYKMGEFKSSAEAAIISGARWLTYCLLPVSFFQQLWREIYGKCTLLVANLAGPTSVLKLDSREVKCMMYWLPPLDKVPLTVSFITYADQIRMAVIADRSVIPNPDLITRDFNHKLETLSKLLAHRRIPGENSAANRHENIHLLSSFTLEDLTAEQIQLEMSLVQQELHEMKLQLESGPSNYISRNDTELMNQIEALKERSRELMMYLRKKKACESENAMIFSEEDDLDPEAGQERPQKPFRRRTLSMSSKMSTASVSSTHRPLSTASTSNLPSPIHSALPSWPEGDLGPDDLEGGTKSKHMYVQMQRAAGRIGKDVTTPVYNYSDIKGRYHSLVS